MKVRLLASSSQETAIRHYSSSYLVDENLAIDAGSIGFEGSPEQQEKVRHIFLTHSHADHVSSLPILLENVYTGDGDCPTIYGGAQTLDAVQNHIFNDLIWPDFIQLSKSIPPFLRLQTLQSEMPLTVAGYRITPVLVNHTIPTFAYIVDDGNCSVIFGGDSGPTERLWQIANDLPNLKAVFLEATFPNSMEELAALSAHLTPTLFAKEAEKIKTGVRLMAIHIKARFRAKVIEELLALGLPVEIVECGRTYEF